MLLHFSRFPICLPSENVLPSLLFKKPTPSVSIEIVSTFLRYKSMSILFSLATMFKLKTNTISEQTTFTTERFDTPTVSSHQGYLKSCNVAHCMLKMSDLFYIRCKYKPWFYSSAPSGPPLNIKTSLRSTSSLSFIWDPPEKDKQNGVIITYTACVTHSENGPCFQTFITSGREWLVKNLNASTKYYVRVLASNKAGSSAYSGSKGFFTNGSKYNMYTGI